MRRYGLPTISLALLALAFVAAPQARAGSLRDDADFFSPEAEQRVTQSLDQIQQRRGKNVVVETYASPPSSIPTGGDEVARNEAYLQWAVERGRATRADVVVLISRNPSHLRVDSSAALKQSGVFTDADQTAAANAMLPAFRQKNYDQGILDGLAYIDRKLAVATGPERATGSTQSRSAGGSSANYPPPPGGSPNRSPAPAPAPSSPMRVGCGGGSMFCLVAAVVIGFLLVRKMMSRRTGYGGGFPVGGAPPPPPGPYGGGYGQPGYGQPGYGQPSRGGFGSGFGGGILGGLLGGWLMNRSSHGSTGGAFGGDPAAPSQPQGLPPTDPSTFGGGGGDFGGGGGDFGGGGGDFGGGGGDFGGGGGGGGGGDAGGGGGDF